MMAPFLNTSQTTIPHGLWRHYTSSTSFAIGKAAVALAADASVDATEMNTLSEAIDIDSSDHPPLSAPIRDVDDEVQMRSLHYPPSPGLVGNDGRAFQHTFSRNQTTGLPYGVKNPITNNQACSEDAYATHSYGDNVALTIQTDLHPIVKMSSGVSATGENDSGEMNAVNDMQMVLYNPFQGVESDTQLMVYDPSSSNMADEHSARVSPFPAMVCYLIDPKTGRICNKSFPTEARLRRHQRGRLHNPTEGEFVYDECGYKYVYESGLNNHLRLKNHSMIARTTSSYGQVDANGGVRDDHTEHGTKKIKNGIVTTTTRKLTRATASNGRGCRRGIILTDVSITSFELQSKIKAFDTLTYSTKMRYGFWCSLQPSRDGTTLFRERIFST